jgi:hypothetical protein
MLAEQKLGRHTGDYGVLNHHDETDMSKLEVQSAAPTTSIPPPTHGGAATPTDAWRPAQTPTVTTFPEVDNEYV